MTKVLPVLVLNPLTGCNFKSRDLPSHVFRLKKRLHDSNNFDENKLVFLTLFYCTANLSGTWLRVGTCLNVSYQHIRLRPIPSGL